MPRKAGWSIALIIVSAAWRPASAWAGKPAESVPAQISSAPVTLGGKQVLFIREPILAISAGERARRTSLRLLRVAGSPFEPTPDVQVIDGDASSDIAVGDLILMSVTDRDAGAEGLSREALAGRDAGLIHASLAAYKRERSLRHLAVDLLAALLITALLVLALRLLNRFYSRHLPAVDAWARRRLPRLKIKNVELVPTARLYDGIGAFAAALRTALTAAALYLYATSVLSLFPWTQGLSDHLLGYILSPLSLMLAAVLAFIPNLFFIAVVVAVVHFGLKLLGRIFIEIAAGRLAFAGFYPDWARPTYEILRFLVWAFAAVVVFPYLPGSSSPAFRGISVFVGVLLSFGSSSAISNVVAGVILTYMRPFKLGDRVKIADTVGDITEKTLLVTRVRTIKNVDVTIPNALVLASHIINYSSSAGQGAGLILNTTVTIGYDAPWKKVHELLISAALATQDVLKEPQPFVLQTSLDDFYVSYQINAYTSEPRKMAAIYSELHQNIQDKFNEGGVEILSPHYAQLRDGNKTTISNDHLSPSYRAPAFRVQMTGSDGVKTP